jgi:dTDP-4-amino-4,6-dideoxygalactose transaminase
LASKAIIKFFGVDRQYASIREEILHATDEVLSSGQVLDGVYTTAFESEVARRCNREYGIAVNSGTQALIFTLANLVPQDSKVLIPTISFAATLNSVLMAQRTPVFCDTDHNGLIDLESLDFALHGAGVGAVMYANLWGHTIDYDRFRVFTDFFNSDMVIVEDAAQSFGAKYKGIPSGKMGHASVLSFDPTKNLNNYGSGGMILTDDLGLAEALADIRDNGKHESHHFPGTNSKMSEADCAQMLVKLKHFDAWQKRRTEIADFYIEQLNQYVDIVLPGEDVESSWHKFVIRLSNRHALKHHLAIEGIETKIHYDKPLFEIPIGYDYMDYARDPFRESTVFSRECLSLPIYPELTDSEVEHIAEAVVSYLQ